MSSSEPASPAGVADAAAAAGGGSSKPGKSAGPSVQPPSAVPVGGDVTPLAVALAAVDTGFELTVCVLLREVLVELMRGCAHGSLFMLVVLGAGGGICTAVVAEVAGMASLGDSLAVAGAALTAGRLRRQETNSDRPSCGT